MRLTVIGCSGSMPGPTSPASSYLLQAPDGAGGDTSILLDLGSGAFGPLQTEIEPGRLDAVILSHLHADHCADLAALEVWLRYGPGALAPRMRLLGPEGLRERIVELTHIDERALEETFSLEVLRPGEAVTAGSLRIEPQVALHPVPAFCFAITGPSERHDGEARLAYTGDTDLCEGAALASRGADLLLAEAAFTHEEEVRGVHLTGGRAGALARDAQARALVLTHLQPWADAAVVERTAREAFGGTVTMATAGRTFTL